MLFVIGEELDVSKMVRTAPHKGISTCGAMAFVTPMGENQKATISARRGGSHTRIRAKAGT
jgi:hypothetical protein